MGKVENISGGEFQSKDRNFQNESNDQTRKATDASRIRRASGEGVSSFSVYLTQARIIWRRSFNRESHLRVWPMGKPVGTFVVVVVHD